MTDFASRRAAAHADIAVLEREQGAALLDGVDFDADLLATRRAEIAAIDAAESEAVRRQRIAEETEAQKARVVAAVAARDGVKALRAAVEAAQEHGQGL